MIAHELGHNLSLWHADCGGPDPASIDPSFPYDNARTGVWGYDTRDGSLVPPDRAELLSYCDPSWISDYFFTNALRFRLQDPQEVQGARVPVTTLLVSGGAAADGALHLDPAFVVDAPPVVPHTSGPYTLTGRRADGSELFLVSFDMAEIWDGDGRSDFAFALPVQSEWEAELASLVLAGAGPDGTVEMREGSEPPMAILRDPQTGQVRAILRDLPAGPLARSAAEAQAPGLDVLFSRGIPDANAWRR